MNEAEKRMHDYWKRMLLAQACVDTIKAERDTYFIQEGDRLKFNPRILKEDRERLERAFGER